MFLASDNRPMIERFRFKADVMVSLDGSTNWTPLKMGIAAGSGKSGIPKAWIFDNLGEPALGPAQAFNYHVEYQTSGTIRLWVRYGEKTVQHDFAVLDEALAPICGGDLLKHIGAIELDFSQMDG